MAIRYGGRYSPDPGLQGAGGRREPGSTTGPALPPMLHRLASRPKWVTLAATPFLAGAFFQPPLAMAADLAAFGLIALAMWLTREGLAAEAAYDQRRVARRPVLPRKLLGGVLAGGGLAIGAAEPGAIVGAAAIGLAGTALHWLSFGADPMRDKGMDEAGSFQQSRASRMIDEGEAQLVLMQRAVSRLGDRQLDARVASFSATVRELFDRVRDNPGDLSATRRYLGVYLLGAREATEKFAALQARAADPQSRAEFETFLDDLEKDFGSRRDRLLQADRSDLDIEISVLRERLAREGLHPVPETAAPRPLTFDEARRLDSLLADPQQPSRPPHGQD